MESFFESIENTLGGFFSEVGKFFTGLWDQFIDLLSKVVPEEFAVIIGISILAIGGLAIFFFLMNSDKR